MIKKLLLASILLSSLFVHGAMVLYCDFENQSSGKTITSDGGVGLFKIDPGPLYSDKTPKLISGRSKCSVDIRNGFLWFKKTPYFSADWTINCYIKSNIDDNGPRTLICSPGAWKILFNTQKSNITLVPSKSDAIKIPASWDKWQMWTFVKKGNILEFYLDGNLLGKQIFQLPLKNDRGQIYVGAGSSSGGHPAKAVIDDLAIWSHSLSEKNIKALAKGKSPLEILDSNALPRPKTVPFTKANTKVYHLKRNLDATDAVIVPNDGPDGMKEANRIKQVLKEKWGIEIPIRNVVNHSDGCENLILFGRGMSNTLSRELAANQQIIRDTLGPELRIIPEALDWKRGIIYLGGRDESEVMTAVAALIKNFPNPKQLKFSIKVLYPTNEITNPEELEANAKKFFASFKARKIQTALRTYLAEAFKNYQLTGEDRHVKCFSNILELIFDFYPEEMKNAPAAPTFEFHLFPQYLYLIENSQTFSDSDRIKSAEYIRAVMEKAMSSWELINPAKSYSMGRQDYYTNHYCFASRTVAASARYLLSRYDYSPAKYFLAVGENTFEGVKKCPLSPEDAAGYQYLVYRIFMEYMLSAGKFNTEILTSPEYKEYLEYGKSLVNHLGYTPGYGDAYSTGMRGPFWMLRDAWQITGDVESAKILAMIARNAHGATAKYYLDKFKRWGIDPSLPVIENKRFKGLRVLTISPVRQKILGLVKTKLPKLDKAVFRSSWQPNADFLAINGRNGGPHGHDDAIGVSQYISGPHLWLLEGDYIRRAVEDHNLVSIIRNGVGLDRKWKRIPAIERFAQVVGHIQNAKKNMALLSLVIEKCNGVDYYRHIAWEARGGFWVIDQLQAVKPGDYRFISNWRTTGKLTSHEQGVIVKQLPAPDDEGLSAFSIAEGTGSAAFGYSEFERTSARGNGSLRYKYSNGVISSRIYWKDATMKTGEKSFFVQYFRPITGQKTEALKIQQIADNIFSVGAGKKRSTIKIGDGIIFSCENGSLGLPENKNISLRQHFKNGIIKSNQQIKLPYPVNKRKCSLWAKYDAQISSVVTSDEYIAVGLENGEFKILKHNGQIHAEKRFPGEISSIAVIPTANGKCFAVGCRPANTKEISAGTLALIDPSGQELWRKKIPPFQRRPGTPTTIFPAYFNGKTKPPVIVAGVEAWHYYGFNLEGEKVLSREVHHSATVGAAGDFDGDGKDELFAGVEYAVHQIFDSKGKRLLRSTTSPWDNAAVFGAIPANGPKRVFSARRDGRLYAESPSFTGSKSWSVRLGGPAYGLVFIQDKIAAATINGYITIVNGKGKATDSIKLPAPLTALVAYDNYLYAPGLDGRVYSVDVSKSKVIDVIDCTQSTGMERFLPKIVVSGNTLFAIFGKQIFKVQ